MRKIEWITFSTDRSVRKSASAIAALFFPSAISRSTSRSRFVNWLSGDSSPRGVLRHQRLDDVRVDHRPAVCDGADRGDELLEILHALLQEVGAPCAAPFEECEHVTRVRILAEQNDADLGIGLAQPIGGLDPFVEPARRHPDVGDDDVRPLCLDGGEQRWEVAAHGSDLEVGPRLEQAPYAFADEVVILREHEPDRHGERIRR